MEKEEAVRLAHMLEAKGMTDDEIDAYFEHAGVKGMKWGVRKERHADIKKAQKANKEFTKNARSIVKQGQRATTRAERDAAGQRYKKEVVDKMKTEAFRKQYRDGNTATRGQMAAALVVSGPYAPVTYAAIKSRESTLDREYGTQVGLAREILREFSSM